MKIAFWLGCASFLVALGQAFGSMSLIFAGFGVALFAFMERKPNVLCMMRDGYTIIDNGDGAFKFVFFDGKWWVCHFSAEWTARYGSTWAFGKGRDRVWWYVPKGRINE